MRVSLLSILVVFFATTVGGCGGDDQPPLQPVTGRIVFRDGAPLKNATVRFRTADRTPPFTASGKTDEQGAFNFEAAEGENTVLIAPKVPRDTDSMTPAQRDRAMNPIDASFLDYATSNLHFQVTPDSAKNHFEIKVWPPGR